MRRQYGQRTSKNSTTVTSPCGLPSTGSAGAWVSAVAQAGDGGARGRLLLPRLVLLQGGDGVAQDGRVGLQRRPHHLDDLRPLLGGEAIRHGRRRRQAQRQRQCRQQAHYSAHRNSSCLGSRLPARCRSGAVARVAHIRVRQERPGEPWPCFLLGDEQRLPVPTNAFMAASLTRMMRTRFTFGAGRAKQGVGTGAQQRLGFRVQDGGQVSRNVAGAGCPAGARPGAASVGARR